MASDLQDAVDGRPGWSTTGDNAASYAPGGEWSAMIRLTTNPNRHFGEVWHVALLRNGAAYQTRFASTLDLAVKLAERLVNGQHARLRIADQLMVPWDIHGTLAIHRHGTRARHRRSGCTIVITRQRRGHSRSRPATPEGGGVGLRSSATVDAGEDGSS